LFDSIIFASVACGFTPRSAIESGTVSDSRIDRIRKAMFGSRYSIHDLSRCRGKGDANLARFNMPLELGFAMSRRFIDEASHDFGSVPRGAQLYYRFPIYNPYAVRLEITGVTRLHGATITIKTKR
jgi:hypothetical protein